MDRGREIELLGVLVRIAAPGVGDEVGLVGLGKGAEAGDERKGGGLAEGRQVEVEVVKSGEQVGGVEAGRDRVPDVEVFAVVSVGEVADVALEGAFGQQSFGAVEFGGVVGSLARDGRVAGFDHGVDAGAFRVGWEEGGDEGGELGVGRHVRGDEVEGFIGYVAEDQ